MARKETDKRITATLDADLYDKLKYAAEKRDESLSEFLREAVILRIRYINEDYYPLAKLEAVRMNQLTDLVARLSMDVRNLQSTTIEALSSLVNMTRGDNYLFDEEEGDSGFA